MIQEDPYLLRNCIVAENRKKRPIIRDVADKCPFCEGNEKYIDQIKLEVSSEENKFLVRIVNNKYPICDTLSSPYGVHDVVIDTPRHLEHPKDFSINHWESLLGAMQRRWEEIAHDPKIKFIQIFKNYGKEAGASISHSHWQIIGLGDIPYHMNLQYEHYNAFYKEKGSCYLCSKLQKLESDYIITECDDWIAAAPYISEFAHETWLVPKRHKKHYGELTAEELKSCGRLLKKILRGYDALEAGGAFNICFMSSGVKDSFDYHFYIKIIPRLSNWAGFELATRCYINTVHPKTHVQMMRNTLKK